MTKAYGRALSYADHVFGWIVKSQIISMVFFEPSGYGILVAHRPSTKGY